MSYQVLARKWRPLTFDEVTGQTHVTTPLRNAIRSGRIPHAILLTGPRGTGKTTLARIFASCLNAEKGPTDAPSPDGYSANVQGAQERLSVEEHLALVSDGSSKAPAATPQGVSAAEQTTVGRGPSTPAPQTSAGASPPAEGW